ncbi:MAG: GntR family transcriptional regulator [Frondihabitans sp.]|nr:GntR family transcriptional regulator [Frondihabitans sp.]
MIRIDPRSPVPPFEQLRQQVVAEIRAGRTSAGQRLPTVRKLAADLGLAPNTVARTYRELEADGFVETRGRNGTVVRPQGDALEREAQEAARTYADRVTKLGLAAPEALRLVARALDGDVPAGRGSNVGE